ncbi:hypothetical protein PAXRUDRAFT_156927 [Paxillus rubicundulus Ve08.2h10]|uniref:Uncharacterized protein n=1 Tax=Paxillus rubicundulus Ve08.2h10 TaxID=930991 RepID=A0A0D0DHV1_9AGAM|nr:hypothetical protein PAXRUDRAFT_156927 [Paxillus rubicundulus Ve08.2h10]
MHWHVNVLRLLTQVAATKEYASDTEFCKFRWQLFHTSLTAVLKTLKPGISKLQIIHWADGHFCCTVYSLGPYIVDYEEQLLLACIVHGWCAHCTTVHGQLDTNATAICHCQKLTETLVENMTLGVMWDEYGTVRDLVPFMNDFPQADIHKLIAPNILHQLIKGGYKDHLVYWVETYVCKQFIYTCNLLMLALPARIAAVESFSGLWHFLQGCGFKQWTGDDSKSMMKVYIAAIEGHVPTEIGCTFCAYLECCYLVQQNIISESAISKIEDAIRWFHHYKEVFKIHKIVMTFLLPCQHAAKHYPSLVRLSGALNCLCLSITKTKHICAVKKPYWHTNKFKALDQMLVINQWLDKISAAHANFSNCRMLKGSVLSGALSLIGMVFHSFNMSPH